MELNTDKKILTAANGLMLMALSRAARAFSDARYLAAARELAAFMEASLFRDGALMACLCGGVLKLPAQLDDLVFYALGLTELYAADYDPAHILAAQRLAREVTAHFSDGNGAYYRTADTAEKLITRPLEIIDGALPSGSSGAAVLFDALFRLTGDVSMRQARDGLLSRICGYTEKVPEASAFALCALLSAVYPAKEILCAAPDEAVPELLKAVTARYSPELTVLLKSPARAWAFSIRHSPVSMMRCVPAAYMPHRMSRCGEAGRLGRLPPPRRLPTRRSRRTARPPSISAKTARAARVLPCNGTYKYFRPERINSPACFGHAVFYSSKVFSSSSISSPKRARAESTGPAVLISTPAIFSRDIGSALLPAERKRL